MKKTCPKCKDIMFHSGQIKTDKQHLETFSFIDSVTDVLYLLTCRNCGYCETWIPDFLIDDLRREVRLHEQDPNRHFYDVEDDYVDES